MMGRILSLFSILLFPLAISANNGTTCPFPQPKSISPCTCRMDDALQVDIICTTLKQDVDTAIIRKLTDAFDLKNDVRLFDIDLSGRTWADGYSWLENFSADTIGKFKLSKLHISKFNSIAGHFYPGAFHGTLEEITTSGRRSWKGDTQLVRINAGVFTHLPNLKKVSLPQTILSISPGAFFNLPTLQEIDLSDNMLRKIEEATFMNLPNLQKLDLSKNENLCHIGNMFTTLKNPDLHVSLAETNVNILLEEVFKPFVETVTQNNGKGKLNMNMVPLQCGCDAKWLKDVNVAAIFDDATCQDGTPLHQVDWSFHDKRCPPSNTPGYDAGYGEMYPHMLISEDRGSVGETNKKKNTGGQDSLHQNYTISARNGPIQISFEYLEIHDSYRGFLRLTDGDGNVVFEKSRETAQSGGVDISRNVTTSSNTVHVEFKSPAVYRSCGRGSSCGKFTPDKFKLNWQGQGGYANDRTVFCECCK